MGYTVRHIVNTNVDTFWQLHFDQELARTMIREFGDAGDFEVVEDWVDDHGIRHRRVEVWSKVEMPAFVKKLIGDGSYTEIGRWDAQNKRYSAECIPKVNAEKFRTSYAIIAHPGASHQHCEREIITENTVNIRGIRGMIEGMLEKAQRESHARSAQFINDWIRTRI